MARAHPRRMLRSSSQTISTLRPRKPSVSFECQGQALPPTGTGRLPPQASEVLVDAGSIDATKKSLRYVRYSDDDFPVSPITQLVDGHRERAASRTDKSMWCRQRQSFRAMHLDDHGSRRSGARSDLRIWHHSLCRGAMGPTLAYHRYFPRAAGPSPSAPSDRHLSLVQDQGWQRISRRPDLNTSDDRIEKAKRSAGSCRTSR